MTTQMNISRRGSFRYETTIPSRNGSGVCVTSSETDKKHILTSTVYAYTHKDDQNIKDQHCQIIHHDDNDHDDSLHCQYSAEYDMAHGHLSYS